MRTEINHIRFGVEVETIGATRTEVVDALVEEFEEAGFHVVESRPRYSVYDTRFVDVRGVGRFKVMADSSLSMGRDFQAEVVTPVLTGNKGLYILTEYVIPAINGTDAYVDNSCGIHVHIDGSQAGGIRGLSRVAKIWYRYEKVVSTLLANGHRRRYCASMDSEFITSIVQNTPSTHAALARAWYAEEDWEEYAEAHYDSSRYRALNLHSYFYRGTIEFRCFNGTLDTPTIYGYVALCMALVARAKALTRTTHAQRPCASGRLLCEVDRMLETLGMIGHNYDTARKALKARARRIDAV